MRGCLDSLGRNWLGNRGISQQDPVRAGAIVVGDFEVHVGVMVCVSVDWSGRYSTATVDAVSLHWRDRVARTMTRTIIAPRKTWLATHRSAKELIPAFRKIHDDNAASGFVEMQRYGHDFRGMALDAQWRGYDCVAL